MPLYAVERPRTVRASELQGIERAAGSRFRHVGMHDIADAEPTPVPILEDRASAGRLLLALAADRNPVGFLIWSPKDDRAYIEEVAVHIDHAGHRLAARMIDALAQDVRGRFAFLTLTTFRDIPWNAPYYLRLGFSEMPRSQAGPEHELGWQHQAEDGLDMTRRLFMFRAVAP